MDARPRGGDPADLPRARDRLRRLLAARPRLPVGPLQVARRARRGRLPPQRPALHRREPRGQPASSPPRSRRSPRRRASRPAQLALAWVLAQGDDIVPIPGTKRRAYLEENAGRGRRRADRGRPRADRRRAAAPWPATATTRPGWPRSTCSVRPWTWNWRARSPSSPARARASASPSRRRSPPRARASSPARAPSRPSRGSTASRRSPSTCTDPEGPARLVGHAVERHGRIDVLVNNVGGVHLRLDGFLRLTDADFEASLRAQLLLGAARDPRRRRRDDDRRARGTIVNVASVNAFFQPDGAVIDYGAAKAALLNVAKALSQELGAARASASPASRRARSRPTCGSATTASPRRSGARPASTRTASASRRSRGIPTGRFTTPRRGRHARDAARLAADGQRQRLELRDRRRPDQDDVRASRSIS